jgi:metal-dependent amidase/aminoacylase/carboxypeptidase family protein
MKDLTADMNTYRESLHKIPELGFQERKTQTYLMEKIKEFGYEPQIICKTGIYVYIEGDGSSMKLMPLEVI